jgi:NTE family protein
MKLFYKTIFSLIILFFLAQDIFAQRKKAFTQEDIKVGVVLSGGGAKGVAHVGVLRMIEEAGIRVDYIGGSSMGAIVAALYSVGYSVDELDSIIRVLDMSKMVEGNIPRENLTYFEKTYEGETFISVPIKKWKIGLPQGLSNGQDVIDAFTELTRAYPGHQDFNKLPIPLVMMATDIETGESIEFHEGNIPLIMRASSSFPSLFSPVEINDRLLVDGGVMNNFPVEEVRKMGADVIIGVSVEDGLYKKEDLTSMMAIIEQISSFKMVEKSEKQKKLVDIYIKPDITDYSVMSFDKAPELLQIGEEEGFKYFNEFLAIAERQQGTEHENKKRLKNKTSYYITEFKINGSKNYTDKFFSDRFSIKRFPSEITIKDIKDGINTIDGTRNFSFVTYELHPKEDGSYKMILNVKEIKNNEFLKIGLHYDNLYGAGLMVKYTSRNRLAKSSILMADIIVSNKPRFDFLFFKDNAQWPGFLFQSTLNQFDNSIPTKALGEEMSKYVSGLYLDIRYIDWTTKLMAQKTINEDFYVGLGIEAKYLHFYSNSLAFTDDDGDLMEREFIFDKSWSLNPLMEIYADTRNNSNYPTDGILFKGEFKFVIPQNQKGDLQDEEYMSSSSFLYLRIDYSLPLSNKWAWTNKLNSSLRIGNYNTTGMSYFFGGYNKNLKNNIYSFFGYPLFGIVDVEDDGFMKYVTNFQYNIVPDIYLLATANYLVVSQHGDKWYQTWMPQYTGYALTVGYDSKIGPVELTTDYSPETGRIGVIFNIGFWF